MPIGYTFSKSQPRIIMIIMSSCLGNDKSSTASRLINSILLIYVYTLYFKIE